MAAPGAVVSLYPENKLVVRPLTPASCGAMIGARPALHFVLFWPHLDFDRVWSMALAGRFAHGHFAFTNPHFGGRTSSARHSRTILRIRAVLRTWQLR